MKRTITLLLIIVFILLNIADCHATDWDYVVSDNEKVIHIDIDSVSVANYKDTGKNMVFKYKVRVYKHAEYHYHAACKTDINRNHWMNVFEYDVYDLKGNFVEHIGNPEPMPNNYEQIENNNYGYFLFISALHYLTKHGVNL